MARKGVRRWSTAEDSLLHEFFAREGAERCAERFEDRELNAVVQRAYKLGLRDPRRVAAAQRRPLAGGDVARAVAMHDAGASYIAIGKAFGVSASTATNAVIAARCRAAGFMPARRDAAGALLASEIRRVRALLMAGLKGVEIQLQMAISAGTVCNQRRRLKADLTAKRQGKTLPPPGGGIAYAGARVPAEVKRRIEALLLEGHGTPRVSSLTGASKTTVGRARVRLVKRLARRGETLPGCDATGRRHAQLDSLRFVPAAAIAELKRRIAAREPVSRAAAELAIGASTAYRIRDALAAEYAARGDVLPGPLRPGSGAQARKGRARAHWCPTGKIYRYRALCRELGDEEAAKHALLAEIAAAAQAEARRPRSFDEQLQHAASGGRLTRQVAMRRADPDFTLGGVATGCL